MHPRGGRKPAGRRALARLVASAGLALCCTGLPGTAVAVEPLQQLDVVLLQPGAVIQRRVDGGSDAMAGYLRRLGTAASDTMRDHPAQIPTAGFIVVAVRPAGQSKTWYDFKPALADATTSALTAALAAVAPVAVKESVVVFALRVSIWGARPPASYAPVPQEWRDAAAQAGRKLDVDALLDKVWPPAP